jgi:hypothetical protein
MNVVEAGLTLVAGAGDEVGVGAGLWARAVEAASARQADRNTGRQLISV